MKVVVWLKATKDQCHPMGLGWKKYRTYNYFNDHILGKNGLSTRPLFKSNSLCTCKNN